MDSVKDFSVFMNALILPVDSLSSNGRTYPRNVVMAAMKAAEGKPLMGRIGMGDGQAMDPADAALEVSGLNMTEAGMTGEIRILDSPQGKILSQMLEDASKVCFRTAGIGKIENGVVEDFQLTYVAAIPADKDAFAPQEVQTGVPIEEPDV